METQSNLVTAGLDIDHLFKANGVETKGDLLSLTRQLNRVPRSHTLPFTSRESVLEHCARATQLVDFLNAQGIISPALEPSELVAVKNYMLYHDIHEIVVGDVPYFVEKQLGNSPSKVRDRIMVYFGVDLQLSPELFQLAKMIDAMEFVITASEDPNMGADNFAGKRLETVLENGVAIIDKHIAASTKYKVDLERFEDLVREAI